MKNEFTVICINIGTPKCNWFSTWNKWKIICFKESQYLSISRFSYSFNMPLFSTYSVCVYVTMIFVQIYPPVQYACCHIKYVCIFCPETICNSFNWCFAWSLWTTASCLIKRILGYIDMNSFIWYIEVCNLFVHTDFSYWYGIFHLDPLVYLPNWFNPLLLGNP